MKDRSHDDAMAELYRDDPELGTAVLAAVEADGAPAELATVRRQLAKADKLAPKETDEKRP